MSATASIYPRYEDPCDTSVYTEVTQQEFFEKVAIWGNVHTTPRGPWPYVSEFYMPGSRRTMGWILKHPDCGGTNRYWIKK